MYDLDRFLKAQERDYEAALAEIRSGHKRSCWIWYCFPQVKGLGFSSTSEFYGIDGLGEAKEYMKNNVLRSRLIEISEALLMLRSSDASDIMGCCSSGGRLVRTDRSGAKNPDDLKLRSSMTLFAEAAPEIDVFQRSATSNDFVI